MDAQFHETLILAGDTVPDSLPQELRALRVASIRRRARQTLFAEGDPAGVFYRLSEGSVMLYKGLPDGRRQISRFLFPGAVFGLSDLEGYRYSAETLELSVLEVLDPMRLGNSPEAMGWLSRQILSEAEALRDHAVLIGCKTAPERLASFVLGLARGLEAEREGAVLPLAMSRQEIGDHLSLAIETVCRLFTRLRRDGLITLDKAGAVRLTDLRRLRELAGAV